METIGARCHPERSEGSDPLACRSFAASRTDAPLTLPAPAHSGIACGDETEEGIAARQVAENPVKAAVPPDPSVQAFLHVAFLRDLQTTPLAEKEQRTATYANIRTRRDAKEYLAEVRQKVEPQRAS